MTTYYAVCCGILVAVGCSAAGLAVAPCLMFGTAALAALMGIIVAVEGVGR